MSEFCREQGKKNEKGLEIGDRVEVLRNENGIDTGTKGTIIEISDYIIGVELDEYEGGHSCGGKGKKGHCRCINSEFLRKIEEKEVEKMSDLKIGDRVRMISNPKFIEFTGDKSIIGMAGTIKNLNETCACVEFDDYMVGHDGSRSEKNGYCWYIPYERLEKIEETKEENEEIKAETIEQKILEVLRKEIAVEIGEEFDVYENGVKRWTCKFEEIGFFHKIDGEFHRSGVWKDIVYNFCRYTFKKKPLFPTKEEPYFYVQMRLDNNGKAIYDGVDYVYWYGKDFDIAMLITGNYFKTEEEAEDNKEKVIEKMNKLLKREVDMESKEEWIVFLDKYDIPAKQNAYRTREEAISEGRKEIAKISAKYIDSEVFGERIEPGVSSFYVGKVGKSEPALFADDIIDDLISDAEKMYGDTADNFLEYVSKQDKEELEVEVNKVIREWIDNHNFMACGLLVEKIEKIEV